MKHSIHVSGHRYALRPVEMGDADTILELRTDPGLNRYLHATSLDRQDQLTWLDAYFDRPGDWYFVVIDATTGGSEGLIGLYDHEAATGTAEWGRWILRGGSLAAVESALLIYRVGFEILKLREMFCRTVAENRPVVSFHDRSGIPRAGTIRGCFHLGGAERDAVEHRIDAAAWPRVGRRLGEIAAIAASLGKAG